MVAGDAPEWLPEGWTMEKRRRKDGRTDRYYTSPVSGCTFRTKGEVLQHLNNEKVDELVQSPICAKEDLNDVVPKSSACSNDSSHLKQNKSHVQGCSEKSQLSLPDGWIVELKTRKSGKKAGDKYKCYYDPATGARCYSMQEVFRHINGGELSNPTTREKTSNAPKEKTSSTSKEKANTNSDSALNVLVQSECSADGLPSGWMKVIKCRKNSSGIRKDPYYVDSVSGYVFRSKKDVFRYVETGEISKYAFKKERESITALLSTTETPSSSVTMMQNNPASAAKRCLFATPISCYKAPQQTAESSVMEPPFQNSSHELPQCDKGSKPKVVAMPNLNNVKGKKVQINGIEEVVKYHPFLSSAPLEMANEVTFDQVAEKHLNSTKNLPNSKLKVPVETDILNVNNDNSYHVKSKGSKQSTRKCLKKVAVRRSLRNKGLNEKISEDVDEPPESSYYRPLGQVDIHPSAKRVLGLSGKSASWNPNGLLVEKQSEVEVDLSELDKMVLKIADDILGRNTGENIQPLMDIIPANVPGGNSTNIPDENGQLAMNMNPTGMPVGNLYKLKNKNLAEPVNEKLSGSEESHGTMGDKISELTTIPNEKPSKAATRAGYKAKNKMALPLQQRRSSRRLAGVEAEPAEMDSDQTPKMVKPSAVVRSSLSSLYSASAEQLTLSSSTSSEPVLAAALVSSKDTKDDLTDSSNKSESVSVPMPVSSKESNGKEPIKQDQAPGVEHPALKNDIKEPGSTLMSPFGDTWPDPCLEFAFKTLTGDLPIFEDTTSMENFFHEQLSVKDCSPTGTSSLAIGISDGFVQPETPIQLDNVGKFSSAAGKVSQENKLKRMPEITRRVTRSSKRAKAS